MEDRDVQEAAAKEGSAVNTMINSKGWSEVVAPAFRKRVEYLYGEFSNATVYEEFVRIQQSINAIKGLLDFVEITLIEGKEALKELRENV